MSNPIDTESIILARWTTSGIMTQATELGLDLSEEELDEFIHDNGDDILEAAEAAGNEKIEELLLAAFSDRADAMTGCDDDD